MASPWSVATLYHAYFGSFTFSCWACRERALALPIIWFILIMALGNIAMSLYVLIRSFQLKSDETISGWFRVKTA
jgi:hypothetical protein